MPLEEFTYLMLYLLNASLFFFIPTYLHKKFYTNKTLKSLSLYDYITLLKQWNEEDQPNTALCFY